MRNKGRPKKIESAEKLKEMFIEYKENTKENPRFKYHLNQRSGDMVGEPLEVPYTMEGFEIFCWENYDCTIKHYIENSNKSYEDFCTIATRIRKEIRDDQIKGGMVGQYNANITARLNALKEQIEQTNIEQPLFPDVSENDSDK
tara:strand:+ start:1572 stop:2003 length:432 start_codon:yes stop_codon:yes gene_type:complete